MAVLLRIWFVSLAILLMIGCSLGDSKEYLMGAITVEKMNSNGDIEAITFHFKDFPYDVSTDCRLSSKNIERDSFGLAPRRNVNQYEYHINTSSYDSTLEESMQLNDHLSPFAGEIYESNQPTPRSNYINMLVGFCASTSGPYAYSLYNQLARQNTTTAITFYPKMIDGKTCTVLEYTGLLNGMNVGDNNYKPTNVVGLFMPLNETKEGCDRYLILASGNQTADWLDSVKVSKINKTVS